MSASPDVEWDSMDECLAHFKVSGTTQLADDVIDPEVDAYVEVLRRDDGVWELRMSTPNGVMVVGMGLEFPMTEAWFWECVHDLDDEVMGEG